MDPNSRPGLDAVFIALGGAVFAGGVVVTLLIGWVFG